LLKLADDVLPLLREAERDFSRLAGGLLGACIWQSSAKAAFSQRPA